MSIRQIEAGFQEAVVRYLRLTLRDCVCFAIPNGGHRSYKTAKLMKRTGALAGVFDLQILTPGGRSFFLECKAGKGKLSPEQDVFKLALIRMGFDYAVIRNMDDVEAALFQWGLKRSARYADIRNTELFDRQSAGPYDQTIAERTQRVRVPSKAKAKNSANRDAITDTVSSTIARTIQASPKYRA
jgi:hypothetical protein